MRFRGTLVFLLALVVGASATGTALAQNARWSLTDSASPLYHDLQATNVPYLAWSGEQLRLVKCDPRITTTGQDADVLVVDWSGAVFQQPHVISRTVAFSTGGTGAQAGRGCVAATLDSVKPGLAVVKLVITDSAGNEVLKHQFLAGWLALEDVTLTPAPGVTLTDVAGGPGDPLIARVRGRLPLGNNFSELGLGGSIMLPDAYASLATRLARSANVSLDRNPLLWDIHDDTTTLEGHVVGSPCPADGTARLPDRDAVDTCAGGPKIGSFARVFGGLTGVFGPGLGPFDPLHPNTFLPDGKLDAGDAPMPPARIDFSIAPNTGAASDIGGVGSFVRYDKAEAYTRISPTSEAPHNFYAPFYVSFIPGTSKPAIAQPTSGTTQAAEENNFPGYLHNGGAGGRYESWDIARVLRTATATETLCRVRGMDFFDTPEGAQSVVVYSDEHGEARVRFLPGRGAFFDSLPGLSRNANGGCDIEGVNPIGTAAVTATARYPYQPVTAADVVSGTLTKTVTSLFRKQITCVPKGTSAFDRNIQLCTAEARGINGSGLVFADELVCFTADRNAEALFLQDGFPRVTDPNGINRLCTRLRFPQGPADADAFAVVEVVNTNGGTVDVGVYFEEEELFRNTRANFDPIAPGPVNTATPAASSSAAPTAPPATAATTAATTTSATTTARRAAVASARLATLAGQRYLVVRVTGPARSARIKVTLIGASGKALGIAVRAIRTNRLTRVPNLRIGKAVRSVRVAVIG
ncbi:MAG: hypothetical protein H0T39_04975 [Actinobacteria bacterium]|nr:hypothetical protein [Actinomycetota bacterium]